MPRQLSSAFLARVAQLKAALDDVYCKSMDDWVEGFVLDGRPTQELFLWECMTLAYQGFVELRELAPKARNEVLQVTLSCSLGESVSSMLDKRHEFLRDQDVREIHARYRSAVDTVYAVDQLRLGSEDQQAP